MVIVNGTGVIPRRNGLMKGDILPGRVLERVGKYQFRIAVNGVRTVVNSRLELREGQSLLLSVEAFSPKLKLKLLASPANFKGNDGQWVSVLQAMGLKADPLSTVLVEHLLRMRIPLRKKEIREFYKILSDIQVSSGIPPETTVLPIGIWFHLYPEVFAQSPAFLLNWMWGKHKRKTENEGEPSALDSVAAEIAGLLGELAASHSVHPGLKSGPEMLLAVIRQKIFAKEQNYSFSPTEMLKFRFLQKQWDRLKKGQWAIIPVQWMGNDQFLFVQRLQTNRKSKYIVQFSISLQKRRRLNFRVEITEHSLQVEFGSSDKALMKRVENDYTLLRKKLEKTTKFNTVHIRPNPRLSDFQGLWDYFREIKLNITGVF